MKIYTRTGDQGETWLRKGQRVRKSDPRIEVLGQLDELNCWIGLSLSQATSPEAKKQLPQIQSLLFEIGAQLSSPPETLSEARMAVGANDIRKLENQIDCIEEQLTPSKRFLLPGGCESAACLHLSRAVCRHLERCIITLADHQPRSKLVAFLNRLSDYFFVLARLENRKAGVPDNPWKSSRG